MAALAATLLSAGASVWRETGRRFEARTDSLRAIAAAVSSAIAPAVADGDRRRIAVGLSAIRDMPGVNFAIAVDTQGRRLAEAGSGGVVLGSTGEVLEANRAIGAFTSLRLGTYLVSAPVVSAGRRVGHVSLVADVSDLRRALVQSCLEALTAGAIAGLFGIALSSIVRRRIVAPIEELTAATDRIRLDADYSRSVTGGGTDEIARLVDAFNDMLGEIRARDDALRRQRDGLADEVAQRTRELSTARDAAEAANAAKSSFLATMSHEIRTPMNGMLVMAELLAAESLDPASRRRADVIVRSGQVLLALINDILDLSKIEAGRMELESVPTDPAELVEDVLQLFEARAASDGLELACSLPADLPLTIRADPLRLRQVLSNLVANALKFTRTGGVLVSVRVVPQAAGPAMLRFAVTDSGIGIPPDRIAALFDAFTQADTSTTGRFGGTGIGLTICRRLVDAMGGDIVVESTPGSGSTFSFTVPLVDATPAHRPVAADSERCRLSLRLSDGPVARALTTLAAELGIEVISGHGPADIVVVDPAHAGIEDGDAAVGRPLRLGIGRFGVGKAASLMSAGRIDAVLEAPIGGRRCRHLLAAAMRGRAAVVEAAASDAGPTSVADLASPEAGDTGFRGLRVLAADDSPVNREVLGEALRRLGAVVTSVESGQDAIDAIGREPFDLVFMDISMPGFDGLETTRRIRSLEASGKREPVPVVALTAHAMGPADAWRDAGMSDVLTKPFTLAAIAACLRRWAGDARSDAGSSCALASSSPLSSTAPPTQASAQSLPLLDRSVLDAIRTISGGGPDLVGRVLAIYRDHAPRLLEVLRAVPLTDHEALADSAHALKSSSRNVGAVAVGALCDDIENAARRGEPAPEAAIAALAPALDATLAAIGTEFPAAA